MRPDNDSSLGGSAAARPRAAQPAGPSPGGLTCAEEQVLRMRLGAAAGSAQPLERKAQGNGTVLQRLLHVERSLRREQRLRQARGGQP